MFLERFHFSVFPLECGFLRYPILSSTGQSDLTWMIRQLCKLNKLAGSVYLLDSFKSTSSSLISSVIAAEISTLKSTRNC